MSRHAGAGRAALAILAVWASLPAVGQHPNQAQGFKPQNVFDVSGIENVNLFNGNLTLTILPGVNYFCAQF
jgi:hypothetical protein